MNGSWRGGIETIGTELKNYWKQNYDGKKRTKRNRKGGKLNRILEPNEIQTESPKNKSNEHPPKSEHEMKMNEKGNGREMDRKHNGYGKERRRTRTKQKRNGHEIEGIWNRSRMVPKRRRNRKARKLNWNKIETEPNERTETKEKNN